MFFGLEKAQTWQPRTGSQSFPDLDNVQRDGEQGEEDGGHVDNVPWGAEVLLAALLLHGGQRADDVVEGRDAEEGLGGVHHVVADAARLHQPDDVDPVVGVDAAADELGAQVDDAEEVHLVVWFQLQSWALSVFLNFKWFFAFFIKFIWLGVGFLNTTGAEIDY